MNIGQKYSRVIPIKKEPIDDPNKLNKKEKEILACINAKKIMAELEFIAEQRYLEIVDWGHVYDMLDDNQKEKYKKAEEVLKKLEGY